MSNENFLGQLQTMAVEQSKLAQMSQEIATRAQEQLQSGVGHQDFFLSGLTVFVLSCFVGYYVVWRVTPALHSPLMAVTNAVSSVIIVGALVAAGAESMSASTLLGLLAIALASVNIFGGFIVTQRMLQMYKKKK